MIRWAKAKCSGGFDPQGRRLIGVSEETGELILAPPGHSSIYGANGTGKSTRVLMPALFSLVAGQRDYSIVVMDLKDGELAAQAAPMLAKMGVDVGVIDDMDTRPELTRFRRIVNPFGSIVSVYEDDARDLSFATETITQALIPEPPNDEKNRYFRDSPRTLLEFGICALLKRNTALTTPGGVAALLYDPDLLWSIAEIEAEEADGMLRAHAKAVLDMRGHEHAQQHVEAARRSLRVAAPGSRLSEAGKDATATHRDLIANRSVVFVVGPQRYMQRLGQLYACHLMSFTDALYAGAGPVRILADEWTNSPVRSLVSSATTLRAYGGELTMVSQSPSEVIRKFGEQEAQTLEDNSITKQWLGFSNFKEAEKISQAMGEQHAVATSLGSDNAGIKTNANLSLIKQRWMSAAELMAMPREQQLVHIKGVGFFTCRTISQETIAPYCDLLADNPLEGGRLTPDPMITLAKPGGRS